MENAKSKISQKKKSLRLPEENCKALPKISWQKNPFIDGEAKLSKKANEFPEETVSSTDEEEDEELLTPED